MTRWWWWWATAALAVSFGLGACTEGSPTSAPGSGSDSATGSGGPSPSPSPSPTADDAAIARARLQAAKYDYDAALRTLGDLATTSPTAGEVVAAETTKVKAAQSQAVVWPDVEDVPHLFYHSLVVDPARAFTDTPKGVGFSQYMVTVPEFTEQLHQLHANGWVMVHPQDLVVPGSKGVMKRRQILLPPGKKPLVLSVDDVSYYEYMKGKGFATKLVKGKDGTVVNSYTDARGKQSFGAYDVVPIVDAFVRAHPDFSYRGAKGTLALTGYNGVLGYRTSARAYGNTAHTRKEQASARAIADALKAEGWNFASHSWGHINMTTSSLERIKPRSTDRHGCCEVIARVGT